MTRKRGDSHSTSFGLWIREQEKIGSNKGFIATDIDYVWCNYKTRKWLLLEEKCYCQVPTYSQKEQFRTLHKVCQNDPDYQGFYLLTFENTSPDDGKMWLNNKPVTRDELIEFLKITVGDPSNIGVKA